MNPTAKGDHSEEDTQCPTDLIPTLPSLLLPLKSSSNRNSEPNNNANANTSSKKATVRTRREFTAQQKLAILSELDSDNPPAIKECLRKYGLSKSSFHRWRQPSVRKRLAEMVMENSNHHAVNNLQDGDHYQCPIHTIATSSVSPTNDIIDASSSSNSMDSDVHAATAKTEESLPVNFLYKGNKKRDMNDKLISLKRALQQFVLHNATNQEIDQYAIHSSFLQVKSREIRDQLLLHDKNLTPEEVKALTEFKGSKSWSCLIGNQLGVLSVQWSERAKANTLQYLEDAANSFGDPKRPKKQRMEFTANEKVHVLREIDQINQKRRNANEPPLTVEEICRRYHTSKSSLHRWRQQYKSRKLQRVLEDAPSNYRKGRDVKRIFKDKLHSVKAALHKFYLENETRMEDEEYEDRVPMVYSILQQKALMIRDELLSAYAERNPHHPDECIDQDNMSTFQHEQSFDYCNTKNQGSSVESNDVVNHYLHGNSGEGTPIADLDSSTNFNHSEADASTELTYDEVQALRSFKASISWIRDVARKYEWKMYRVDENDCGDEVFRRNLSTLGDHQIDMEDHHIDIDGPVLAAASENSNLYYDEGHEGCNQSYDYVNIRVGDCDMMQEVQEEGHRVFCYNYDDIHGRRASGEDELGEHCVIDMSSDVGSVNVNGIVTKEQTHEQSGFYDVL